MCVCVYEGWVGVLFPQLESSGLSPSAEVSLSKTPASRVHLTSWPRCLTCLQTRLSKRRISIRRSIEYHIIITYIDLCPASCYHGDKQRSSQTVFSVQTAVLWQRRCLSALCAVHLGLQLICCIWQEDYITTKKKINKGKNTQKDGKQEEMLTDSWMLGSAVITHTACRWHVRPNYRCK